ncbi:hypothetical protein N7V09_19300 [Shewanella seohaensis]|uniref:hypothetical protein n=1 Tax=Shewanella seohaensis TaxID=755175 RepID=UPI00200BBCDD|nr:hypothetical protein [Shewanella seohaensis]MCL1119185.1 hypothetical protein [Shewanella seohaensis]UXM81790.1 hypothetical protein N7V09_19300 [Shewanella seohaensis]
MEQPQLFCGTMMVKILHYIQCLIVFSITILLSYMIFKKIAENQPLAAVLYFLVALLVTIPFFLRINPFTLYEGYWETICAIFMVVGIIAAIIASPIFDFSSTKTDLSLMTQSITNKNCPYEKQRDVQKRNEYYNLNEILLKKCALQSNRDQLEFVINISKATYLDPVTGTIDSLYNDLNLREKPMTCQDIAKIMDSLCPGHLIIRTN